MDYHSFRQDLIVSSKTDKDTGEKSYLVKDPKSGETFELGEEEYFLCQSMDGTATPSQISASFQGRFGLEITESDLDSFSQQMSELGLLQPVNGSVPASSSESGNGRSPAISESEFLLAKRERSPKRQGKTYIIAARNPSAMLANWARVVKPLKPLCQLLVWLLIPGVPVALLTLVNNQSLFWQDIGNSVAPVPFLVSYGLNLMLVNLTARLAEGIVLTSYGIKVEKFGLALAAGLVPRFSVDREGAWALHRQQQLWCFATPLIVRLLYFVWGTLFWYWNRSSGTSLGIWALLLGHSALMAFLVISCPLLPSDGYRFSQAYFRLPRNFLARTYLVWRMVLRGRPLPKSMSVREKLLLLGYGPGVLVVLLFLMLRISLSFARGLASSFPGIFGRGTLGVLICITLGLVLGKRVKKLWRRRSRSAVVEESVAVEKPVKPPLGKRVWKGTIRLGFLLLLGVLLSLPYPYRPGGQIQLLRPAQQEIQAQVDGTIVKVMFDGGDGKLIAAGTPIAIMEAADIENDVLTTRERIKNQQAVLAREQATLNRLLNTPRPEEVEVARRKVRVARQEVEVARQEVEVARQEVEVEKRKLDAGISQAEFSTNKAKRMQSLYEEGAISLQDWEDEQKRADNDRIAVEELGQSLAVKEKDVLSARNQLVKKQEDLAETRANLELVLSGAHPDEIAAARKQVEAARAQIDRLEQELKYAQSELQRTELLMPLDGRLITPYLPQKRGSYLEKGDRFAVAEDDRIIQGEVRVPEYNVGEFAIGAQVEVKLLAYHGESLLGKVVAIEPTAALGGDIRTDATERVVRVIVDLENTERLLKAGMTGYAKITGSPKPLIVAFTRPIVRFIQVEVWSWLP